MEMRGLPILDADKLGHPVLESEKKTIFAKFGNDLEKADGSLNRRLLAQRTFGKPDKLAALEAIVHPPVNRLIDEWVIEKEKKGLKAYVINAALLHKSSVFNRLNRIIIVHASYFTRFFRAYRRDNLSFVDIFRRFNSQKDFNTQYLTASAEIYRVENSGLFNSQNLNKKLELMIDKCLEGI
jgi:dephospho-CoA kinase